MILRADPQLSTLVDVSRRALFAAENGRPGAGGNCTGRQGASLTVDVPAGTLVRLVEPRGDPRTGPLLADLSAPGQSVVVARGGRGGRGNRAFATATEQVPRTAEDGGAAVERRLYLELKLLADVGLVGLPNAGKSTLLSRVSSATPKIADYPFTTLQPHLGIVEVGDWNRLVFADIPGLIEGAHEGHGLGIDFLRHLERTRLLVHLISVEEPDVEDIDSRRRIIEEELAGFNDELARKPRLIVLSKCDLLPGDELDELVEEYGRAVNRPVLGISAITGKGIPELLRAVEATLESR